jgi:hypothetical protein
MKIVLVMEPICIGKTIITHKKKKKNKTANILYRLLFIVITNKQIRNAVRITDDDIVQNAVIIIIIDPILYIIFFLMEYIYSPTKKMIV